MFDKILHFFEKNGLLKILGAFILIILALVLNNHFPQGRVVWEGFAYVGAIYLCIAFAIGIVFGISGALRDLQKYFKDK